MQLEFPLGLCDGGLMDGWMVFEADRVFKLGSVVTSFVYEPGIHMRARTFTTVLIFP